MPEGKFAVYKTLSLADLQSELSGSFYTVIGAICKHAAEHASALHHQQNINHTQAYLHTSFEWINEVEAYTLQRRQVLLPYLQQLHNKQVNGHNCGACSGGCSIQHSVFIAGFKASHTALKSTHSQFANTLHHSPNGTNLVKQALYTQLLMLHNSVADMLCMEEEVLLPKIIEAQTLINAHT